MIDTSEILGILDMAEQRRTTEYGQTTMYKEHVRRAAEVIRLLEQELRDSAGAKQKCDRAPWCVYDLNHSGGCSLIRPRVIEVSPLTLGTATDALTLADEFLDEVHEEHGRDVKAETTRKRKIQVEIDRALEELARAQGMLHIRCYSDDGRELHGDE
jgi:hypothetical protein